MNDGWRETAVWYPAAMSDHARRELRREAMCAESGAYNDLRDYFEETTRICPLCGENEHKGGCHVVL